MLKFGEYKGVVKSSSDRITIVSIKRNNIECESDKSYQKGSEVKVQVSGVDMKTGMYKGHIL